ncbi:MAG TPA: oxalurate catabolism protein HpxZ [Caulobacteraceae bacterium]|nr:oxalurate catabolism protein HpxZ [Caulobacteraceae bacterium]
MKVNDPAVLAELTAAFEAYEQALMTNDVEQLDRLFWDSPHTVRYGVGENLYGSEEIAAFRRARGGGAPRRVLTRTSITSFGDDFGTACTEYVRVGGAAIGRQTHSWARLPEGWRIVAAHVSQMADIS